MKSTPQAVYHVTRIITGWVTTLCLKENAFISEYLEGSGDNQAIEIFNPTNTTVALSYYQLKMAMDILVLVMTCSGGALSPPGAKVYCNADASETPIPNVTF